MTRSFFLSKLAFVQTRLASELHPIDIVAAADALIKRDGTVRKTRPPMPVAVARDRSPKNLQEAFVRQVHIEWSRRNGRQSFDVTADVMNCLFVAPLTNLQLSHADGLAALLCKVCPLAPDAK